MTAESIDLDVLSAEELNSLDCGVIALDPAGRVQQFNEAAAALSGRSADAAIGCHFFRDVVPSANVPGFHGRFLSGVRRGRLDERFEFVFGRRPQPLRARIGMRQSRQSERWWLTVEPLGNPNAGHSREEVIAAIGQRTRAEPVDPNLCEREPIHLPGSIQPNAVMIGVDPDDFTVVAYSANFADILPDDGKPLVGRSLDTLLPTEFAADLRSAAADELLDDGLILSRIVRIGAEEELRCHVMAHRVVGSINIEFERLSDDPADFASANTVEVDAAMRRLRTARSVEEAALIVVGDIRALTDFESVLVYRFDRDWNGEAIAEDMISDWNRPLHGLRFPASDIPAQARALYTKARSRFVIDRDCAPVPLISGKAAGTAPIDLSLAQSRTLSPIHLEYQRNLGVNGSMSISILVDGRLWGLMIGHHRRPHYVAPETRAAATALTDAFAMQIQEIEARRNWAAQQAHLEIEGRLVRALANSDNVVQALTASKTTLLDLFGASGAGIVTDETVTLIGGAPDEAAVRILAAWLKAEVPPDRTTFVTASLGSEHPKALAYANTASGLLAVFVDPERTHLLLWFKPEVPSTVTWGGDPRKPVIAGSGTAAVLPRRSFERWVEERSGLAEPFSDWQVSLAEQFAQAVEGVVLRQRRKIDELTGLLADKEALLEQKDLLTKEIDHRVKNSLQIVSAFLQLQGRQVADPAAREAFAETSARVMSVARVHDSLFQTDGAQLVDLGQTIANLCSDLASMAGDAYSVELSTQPGLMVPYQKAVALSLITTELVTNAFKYAIGATGGARVAVSVAGDGDGLRVRVCDDGAGLSEGWEKNKPRGTGLGMKLVRAMLDQIDGRMEFENAPGACFTVHA